MNDTALAVAALVSNIKKQEDKLAKAKADLIALVGDDGQTIKVPLGTVTVTKRTEDRSTGQFSYSLDTTAFMALDERIQANLRKQGVVKQTEKVTKGQAPTVRVKLED